MNLSRLISYDLFCEETLEEESRRVGRSGPVFDEDGFCNFLYFIVSNKPLRLLPSVVVVPDESQSWMLVQYDTSWFTWVPIRLLHSVDSSKDQVRKMFDYMSSCPVTSAITDLEDLVTDDLATFLHSKASKVLNEKDNQTVVIRVKLFLLGFRTGFATDDHHFDDEIKYTLGPATKDFLESKLVRFEIGVNEGCDGNDPCSICLEEFQVGLVAKMPCGHVFHDGCITKWLKTSGSCPVCKFEADCEYTDDDDDDDDVEGDSDVGEETTDDDDDRNVGEETDDDDDDDDVEGDSDVGEETTDDDDDRNVGEETDDDDVGEIAETHSVGETADGDDEPLFFDDDISHGFQFDKNVFIIRD